MHRAALAVVRANKFKHSFTFSLLITSEANNKVPSIVTNSFPNS